MDKTTSNIRRRLLLILAIAVLAAALAAASGCGGGSNEAANIDFPEFVYRSEESLDGYKIAAVNQDVIEQIPCYCGCERDPEKYHNLKDCFYDRQTGDFAEHASSCAICLEEARDIKQWQGEGNSVKEIRDKIDQKYEGRGTPTDTPPVQGTY